MAELLYHERLEKKLSAVHCINNLSQTQACDQEMLTLIATDLDREDALKVGVEYNGKVHSYHHDEEGEFVGVEYHKVHSEDCCSHHCDEEGNFSTQVIQRLIQMTPSLELVDLKSNDPRAVVARFRTADQDAYICKSGDHWYSIRKFDDKWFSLDSRLPRPMQLTTVGPHIPLFLSEDRAFSTEKFDEVYTVCGHL